MTGMVIPVCQSHIQSSWKVWLNHQYPTSPGSIRQCLPRRFQRTRRVVALFTPNPHLEGWVILEHSCTLRINQERFLKPLQKVIGACILYRSASGRDAWDVSRDNSRGDVSDPSNPVASKSWSDDPSHIPAILMFQVPSGNQTAFCSDDMF